jgi:hypothetical protein
MIVFIPDFAICDETAAQQTTKYNEEGKWQPHQSSVRVVIINGRAVTTWQLSIRPEKDATRRRTTQYSPITVMTWVYLHN